MWSLTLIEPAAFGVARGNVAVERLLGRLQKLFARAADSSANGTCNAWAAARLSAGRSTKTAAVAVPMVSASRRWPGR